MGCERRLRDLRPHEHAGCRVGVQRVRPFAEPSDGRRELAKTARPGGDRGGRQCQRRAELVDRRARLGGQRGAEEDERRLDAEQDLRADDGAAGALVGGDRENAQMAGEIPAVDGGDVAGLQRLERARVVPVVEVSAVALEIRYRRQGRAEPVDRVERADEAEVSRGRRREQIDTHVRRRSPVSDDGPWVLLEVVRRQEALSSAVTKVSKKRQLLRAAARMVWRWSALRCSGGRAAAGRLIQRATAGESSHRTTSVTATARVVRSA